MQRSVLFPVVVLHGREPPGFRAGIVGTRARQWPRAAARTGHAADVVCPAGDGRASVYGTDVYTAESGVCSAAIHAGVLKLGQAGAVTVVFGGAAESFRGSARNGVTTQSYGRWPYTYTFAKDGSPGRVSWSTVWSQIPTDFLEPVSVECPPAGKLGGPLWGTGTYTKDSTICVAGVHAGAITAAAGVVIVKRVPGLRDYAGTERFGVVSTEHGPTPMRSRSKRGAQSRTVALAAHPRLRSRRPPRTPTAAAAAHCAPSRWLGSQGTAPRRRAGRAPSRSQVSPGPGAPPAGPRTIGLTGFSGHGAAPQ